MSNNLALPPGVDPRMLAFIQAQQRLQQQPNGQFQQFQQQQQRPGGDADVASFLLQLKTNQNGEPVTDAEALQQLNAVAARSAQQQQLQQQHQQHQQQQQHQQHMPLPQAPATVNGLGYPQMMQGMNLYPYPGMGVFPQANAPNANLANNANPTNNNFKFYNPMQPQVQMPHPPQGLAPMQQPGGVVPGLNHSPQQMGMHGGPPPADSGPAMTDAYIESLIAPDKEGEDLEDKEEDKDPKKVLSAKDDMNIPLVVAKDRDLIPDALFVALGQMKPCRLQQSDRVGCYKTRALGYLGMTCKHCGGQPGFGRYFPNSVRSLAQTTTSQTILKHIGGKCRFCPPHIRKAVLELQRQQAHKEHLSAGRPRYGSRKIFFQRMWARIHGPPEDGETPRVVQCDVTSEIAREEAEAAAAAKSIPVLTTKSEEDENENNPSPVSNNNSDDEGPSVPPPKGENGVLNISPSLEKKRKLTLDETSKEGSSEDEDNVSNTNKKLRISPVAV